MKEPARSILAAYVASLLYVAAPVLFFVAAGSAFSANLRPWSGIALIVVGCHVLAPFPFLFYFPGRRILSIAGRFAPIWLYGLPLTPPLLIFVFMKADGRSNAFFQKALISWSACAITSAWLWQKMTAGRRSAGSNPL